MSPEEKAIVLVYKFDNCMEFSTPQRFAKQCALIAVDEILTQLGDDDLYIQGETNINYVIEYWREVKNEIEKL